MARGGRVPPPLRPAGCAAAGGTSGTRPRRGEGTGQQPPRAGCDAGRAVGAAERRHHAHRQRGRAQVLAGQAAGADVSAGRAGPGRRGGAGAVTASSCLGGAVRGGRDRDGPPAGRGGGGGAGLGACLALPCPALPRPASHRCAGGRAQPGVADRCPGSGERPEDGHGPPRGVRSGPGGLQGTRGAWGPRDVGADRPQRRAACTRRANSLCKLLGVCRSVTPVLLRYGFYVNTEGQNTCVQNSAWFVRSTDNKKRGAHLSGFCTYRHVYFATGNSGTESLEGFILKCPEQDISCSAPCPCVLFTRVLVHIF